MLAHSVCRQRDEHADERCRRVSSCSSGRSYEAEPDLALPPLEQNALEDTEQLASSSTGEPHLANVQTHVEN